MAEPQFRKDPKQPPLLFDKTQTIITRIEEITRVKTLCYWNSRRGNVCDNDVIALYEIFKKIGAGEEVRIFIKSSGGDVEAALRIVNLIREYYNKIIVYVPLECASAATMISLGADEIQMGPLAHLTAIDSSLRHNLSPKDETDNRRVRVSQDELARLVNLVGIKTQEIIMEIPTRIFLNIFIH